MLTPAITATIIFTLTPERLPDCRLLRCPLMRLIVIVAIIDTTFADYFLSFTLFRFIRHHFHYA